VTVTNINITIHFPHKQHESLRIINSLMDLNNMAENLYKEIVAVIKMPLHNREKFAVSILEVAQISAEEGSKSFMSRTRIYKCRRHF
jgi:hypothetical protein